MSRKLLMAAALVAGPLLGMSSAWAGPCAFAPVSTYTASGFSCSIGPLTFSNIAVSTPTTGSGTVGLGDFNPVTFTLNGTTEYGLQMSYSAATGTTANSSADVALTYNLSASPGVTDAYMSLAATQTGTGTNSMSEVLSNGVTLALHAAGTATIANFGPDSSLSVMKDQNNLSGSAGTAEASLIGNAFSVGGTTPVPEPASLSLFGVALLGLGLLGRRKRV